MLKNVCIIYEGPGAPVNNPCYEMYAGSHPFSEKESTALANFLNQTKDGLIAYISLHSFGQAWMTPWGFTKKLPKQYAEQVWITECQNFTNFSASCVTIWCCKISKKVFSIDYVEIMFIGSFHEEKFFLINKFLFCLIKNKIKNLDIK